MSSKEQWWRGHEEEIKKLLEKNNSLEEIAKNFKVSITSAWRATRDLNKNTEYSTSSICWEREKTNIEKLMLDGFTYSEIADQYNTTETTVRRHVSELGIDKRLINPKTKQRKYSDNDIINAVKKSTSYAGVLREIGLKPIGGNHSFIKNKINKLGLDTSHFTGQLWSKGKTKDKDGVGSTTPSLEDIFSNKIKTRSSTLRERLINAGLKERKCECCGNTKWNGKPISLELHHKDGNHNNNSFDNLQILCPNCHSQTDFYRGKGVSKSYKIPNKDELLDKLKECRTVKAVAKSYMVSESTIRSWVKKNNIKEDWAKAIKEFKKH